MTKKITSEKSKTTEMIFIGWLAEVGFSECVRGYKNASYYTIKTNLQGGKCTVANSCNIW